LKWFRIGEFLERSEKENEVGEGEKVSSSRERNKGKR